MIKKTILMLLVLVGGVMSANADNPYKIVGGFTSWNYGESDWTMTQNTTQTNIWYYYKKGWVATGESIAWKVLDGSTWIPSGDNKLASFTKDNAYDLLFILNTDDSTVKLLSSVSVYGPSNSWDSGTGLTMSNNGFEFSGSVNIGYAGEKFKFLIAYNGDSDDNVWIGFDSGAECDFPGGAIFDGGGNDHNFTFSNIANGFDTFNFKATWNPSKGHTSTPSAWTLSITPGNENSSASKVYFTNPDNWTNVCAYFYNSDSDKEWDWPGYSISKINEFYTFYYITAKDYIIFNNGGNGSQYPTEGGYHVENNHIYGSSETVEDAKVSVTLGKHGYTTFSSNFALDLDNITNATAYKVFETLENSVKLVQATGTVAAGEGLVLYGNDATKTVTIPVAISGTSLTGNLLVGCPSGATLDKQTANYSSIYVLVNTDTRPEFQNVKNWIDGNHTVSIPAGKAYLQVPTTNGAPSFSLEFDDETTGIANIERAISDNQYYTLDGRRVAQPTKGLYIVNGKKVIIK